MEWKAFLKPTPWKISLSIMFMFSLNFWIISTYVILDGRILVGVPLGFWPTGSVYLQMGYSPPPPVEFSWINFIIDILFWYLLSCIIVFLYNKYKMKLL